MLRGLAIAAVLGACGDGRMLETDAGSVVDASERGIVRVKVTGFVEKAGLRVYFQDRDSAVALATRTDANGEVAGRIGPGGFVTLVAGFEPALELWTYTDVSPGDELEFFEPEAINTETPTASVSIFASAAGAPPFTLRSSCGGATTLFDALPVAPLLAVCGDRMDFLLEQGQIYRYARDVDMTQPAIRVDFPAPFIDYASSQVTVSGVPGTRVFAAQSLIGQAFELERTEASASITDGVANLAFGLPLPENGTLLTQVDSDDLEAQHVVDWRPATAQLALAFDAVTVAPATDRPRYDATRTAIVWSEGAGTPGDLVRATLHWLDVEHARTRTWVVIGPRAASEPALQLPLLPAHDLVPATDGPQTMESFVTGDQGPWLRLHLHGRWLARGVAWPTHGAAGRITWRSL